MSEQGERQQRYIEAIIAAKHPHGYIPCTDEAQSIARAVMAVADAEQEALLERTNAAVDSARWLQAAAEDGETRAVELAEAMQVRVEAATDNRTRAHAWMAHLGYTSEQIAEAERWSPPNDSEEDDPRPEPVRDLDMAAEFANEYGDVIRAALATPTPDTERTNAIRDQIDAQEAH